MIIFMYRDGKQANRVRESTFNILLGRKRDSIAWWYKALPEQVERYCGKEHWQDIFMK